MYKSNRERTRDLLLEYDKNIMPPRPRAAEFSMVYPWESIGLSLLGDQIFMLASRSGYTGTREEFHRYFGSYLEKNRQAILFENYENFPVIGSTEMLYFDLGEKILYYWDNGYIPVNTMLIAHTILNGGDA